MMVDFDTLTPDNQALPQPQSPVPTGQLQHLDFDSLTDDQDKYGSLGQQALAGVEGITQGLAGPVATGAEALLSKAGVPGLSPHEQELRSKANPITRYGTEGLSFGLSSLYGVGEAALLNEIGHGALEAANLGKYSSPIVKGAVSGAAEVSALQAGNEISKNINQDPGQTLGSAAINVGLAGILGAGGGAALGSVGPIWKSFTKAAAEDAGVSAEIAAGQGAQSIGGQDLPQEDLLTRSVLKPKEKESFLAGLQKQKPNADEIRDAGNALGIPVSSSQTSASDYVQSMDSALSQSPTLAGVARRQEIDNGFDKIRDIVGGIFGDVDESTPFQRGQTLKDQIQNKVDQLYDPLKQGFADKLGTNQHIELPDDARLKFYDGLIENSQKFGSVGSKGGAAIRDVAERVLSQNTAAQLDELISEVGSEARAARRAGNDSVAKALNDTLPEIKDFQIKQIVKQGKTLQGQGAEYAEAIANDFVKQNKELNAKYADFKNTLADLSGDAKLGKANTYGRVEEALDNIPNERLVEKMFDPKNSAGLSRLQNKFPEVFKTVVEGKKADLIAAAKGDPKALLESIFGMTSKGSPKLSPEIRAMMFSPEEISQLKNSKTWIDSLPKNVGPSGTPKGSAYMAALQAHPIATIINNSKDYAIKSLLKFATPAEIEKNKIASDYINSSVKGSKILDAATKAFFKSSDVLPNHHLPNESSRERLKKQLDAMNGDPSAAVNVGGDIGHYLPNHATAAGMMAASAQNYFNSIKPQIPPGSPLDKKPQANKMQESKYNRALDIAQQPLLVLKHAKDGTLQSQDIQTLNTIYPALHSQIVSKLSEQMNDHLANGDAIPYSERKSLSMLLGMPLDSTMTTQSAQTIMASNAGQVAQQGSNGQQAKQHKASGSELSQINKVNKLYSTASEQRQMNKKA